jgi:hypothetical protein
LGDNHLIIFIDLIQVFHLYCFLKELFVNRVIWLENLPFCVGLIFKGIGLPRNFEGWGKATLQVSGLEIRLLTG